MLFNILQCVQEKNIFMTLSRSAQKAHVESIELHSNFFHLEDDNKIP